MSNKSTKGYNGTIQAKQRRSNVITRLEAQLQSKRSLARDRKGEPLSDGEEKRINRELDILRARI
jgi:hypothetical protein